MLENMKSIYFLEILFSYLNERPKFGIIKYNKRLQKNIKISLINYTLFSTKYIIYETGTTTKGKIYDAFNDKLMYEGGLLNGKKNGKGKEYYHFGFKEELIYEGSFLNGKRDGKGKQYLLTSGVVYEVQYSKGKK